jgi:hypothetical protein
MNKMKGGEHERAALRSERLAIASDRSELLGSMRATCWSSTQHEPCKFAGTAVGQEDQKLKKCAAGAMLRQAGGPRRIAEPAMHRRPSWKQCIACSLICKCEPARPFRPDVRALPAAEFARFVIYCNLTLRRSHHDAPLCSMFSIDWDEWRTAARVCDLSRGRLS